MDRVELSSAIIQEMQALVGAALEGALPELLSVDLATLEQRVQQVGRVLLGGLIERVAAGQAQGLPRPVRCTSCGGRLKRRERTRHLVGLVGDYALRRDYYWCARCRQGAVPLDAALGLGAGSVSPGLTRVVARATVETSFAQAVEQVQEALGAQVSEETARRVAEHLGAVAEAQTQAAVARAQTRRPVWSATEGPEAPVPATTTLAVEVDGVQVHRDDGWHDMKVVTVAPLGPQLHTDRASGRTHLRWGRASYGVGAEGAEEFWWRVYVEALRRGLGTPAVRTVVVLGDGAEWIWHRAKHFLGVDGVEVVEIVDIYHAYEYLWAVGNALDGAGSPCAAAWVEPLKDQLYAQGAAPVLRALAALAPPTAEAREAVADAQSYFTTQATRMDYPRFVARQFPIGSGAVESSCKCVVEARLKQAGMRWATAGSQAIASLRSLHRSGRWTAFWQMQPHAQSVAVPSASTPQRAAAPPPARPATPVASASRLAPAGPSVAAAHVRTAPSTPRTRPNPTRRQRPLILPRSA
jgi:Uncharacterised protein family (UPF0236)